MPVVISFKFYMLNFKKKQSSQKPLSFFKFCVLNYMIQVGITSGHYFCTQKSHLFQITDIFALINNISSFIISLIM